MRIHTRLHKFIVLVLGILVFTMGNFIVFAEGYPEWKDQTIQDESKQFPAEKVDQINLELAKLPYPTKVFILDKIDQSIEEYTHTAYDYYQMPDDQLFIVYVMETSEMAAIAGKTLEEKGINATLLNEKMNSFFKPQAIQGDYLGGIHFLINEVFTEIEKSELQQVEIVKEVENNLVEAASKDSSDSVEKDKSSWLLWIGFISTILFLIFLVLIWQRKRLNKRLLELEEIKENLERFWEEVELNASVQTVDEEVILRLTNLEATYEDYRNRIFPELNEDFADAHLLLKRFRIFAVKEFINYIDETLQDASYLLDQFDQREHHTVEIRNELPKSLEQTHTVIESIKRRIDQVAAQYGLGLSALIQEIQVKEKELLRLQAVAEKNGSFDLHLLEDISLEIQKIDQNMNQIDLMSQEMEEIIPNRLKNLEQKYKKESEQGELKNSSVLLPILKEAREKWNSLITLWDEGRVNQLVEVITSINARINQGELIIHQQETQGREIQEYINLYEKQIQEILDIYHNDLRIYDKLVRKYQLDDDPIVDLVERIDAEKKHLEEAYTSVIKFFDQRDYDEAHQLAKAMSENVSKFSNYIAEFHQRTQALSSEEELSNQELKSLRNRLRLVRQQLDRSLLPGKQDHILEMIELGFRAILETEVLFDQIPLRLNKIKLQLDQAREQVEDVEAITTKTIEDVQEAEAIIRRLNIYRTQIPQIGHLLMMAENCFRDQNFDEAVSIARKAESLLVQKRA